jgi:hypothetical protein
MVALLKTPPSFVQNYKMDNRERRMFARKETHTRVEGKRIDHSITARQQPHVSLSLRDLSFGGLSAMSDLPLLAGERVAVFFPPQGSNRGWDAYGRVIRCDPGHIGYRVAVEFDPLPMAA